MDSLNLADFVSSHGLPESLVFECVAPPTPADSPVRVQGTLQAGNAHAIFLLVGTVVLKIPASVIEGIRDVDADNHHTVEVFITPDATLEARTQLILAGTNDSLPLALNELGLNFAERSPERIERDSMLVMRLIKTFDPRHNPFGESDGGTATYSYLSSATTKVDGGTDSDPIREQDD